MFKDAAGSLPRQTDAVVRMQMHEVVYNSLDVVEERRTSGALRCRSVAFENTAERDRDFCSSAWVRFCCPLAGQCVARLLLQSSYGRVSLH